MRPSPVHRLRTLPVPCRHSSTENGKRSWQDFWATMVSIAAYSSAASPLHLRSLPFASPCGQSCCGLLMRVSMPWCCHRLSLGIQYTRRHRHQHRNPQVPPVPSAEAVTRKSCTTGSCNCFAAEFPIFVGTSQLGRVRRADRFNELCWRRNAGT